MKIACMGFVACVATVCSGATTASHPALSSPTDAADVSRSKAEYPPTIVEFEGAKIGELGEYTENGVKFKRWINLPHAGFTTKGADGKVFKGKYLVIAGKDAGVLITLPKTGACRVSFDTDWSEDSGAAYGVAHEGGLVTGQNIFRDTKRVSISYQFPLDQILVSHSVTSAPHEPVGYIDNIRIEVPDGGCR